MLCPLPICTSYYLSHKTYICTLDNSKMLGACSPKNVSQTLFDKWLLIFAIGLIRFAKKGNITNEAIKNVQLRLRWNDLSHICGKNDVFAAMFSFVAAAAPAVVVLGFILLWYNQYAMHHWLTYWQIGLIVEAGASVVAQVHWKFVNVHNMCVFVCLNDKN